MGCSPHMAERGAGRIVNITSIGGKVSVPHLLPYCCAKFAAVAFSEGLRAELYGSGIKTVAIALSVSASLPGLSIGAERAVRQIVSATKRGRAEKVLSTQAGLLALFHGVFPGLTADALGIAAQALPHGRGYQSRSMEPYVQRNKLLRSMTILGQRAARRYLQKVA